MRYSRPKRCYRWCKQYLGFHKSCGWLLFLTVLTFNPPMSKSSLANWEVLPESRHALYQTYGLFFEQQSAILFYAPSRAWGAVGGTLALYGNNESPSHPQILMHATANAAMTYNETLRIYTQTVDARVGFAYQFSFSPALRCSIGLTHNSAHAADGIQDMGLFEAPLGQEYVPIRIVYDYLKNIRVGATFKPFIRSYPSLNFFASDQFVEYFPWGANDKPHAPSFYIAAGFDEYGVADALQPTFHAQIGFYIGNHFSEAYRQTIRGVLGYYSGADPRLKYYQFLQATDSFAYAGMMFDF